MTNAYYVKELLKLRAILESDGDKITVSSDYVIEKIDRILNGMTIAIHPGLKKYVFKQVIMRELIPTASVLHSIDPMELSERTCDMLDDIITREHLMKLDGGNINGEKDNK